MPPHKPVKSLYDLARSATCQLVLSSCNNIQELHPNCGPDLNSNDLKTPSQRAVKSVQELLQQNLPASVFEDLFHTVLDQERISEISDMRIVYSIFIYNKMPLSKLRITNPIITHQKYGFPMINAGHMLFWLNRTPMLSNLVEIDMSKVSSDFIVLAFCCSCPRLTTLRIKHVSSPQILASILRLSTHLRSLVYNDSSSSEDSIITALTSLDTNHKLKLRDLSREPFGTVSPEQLRMVIDRCPEMQNLDLRINANTCSTNVIFQILAESTLKLKCVQLKYPCNSLSCNDIYDYYLSCKGKYITGLIIYSEKSANLMQILEAISDKCHNLRTLVVLSAWTPSGGEEYKRYQISFPKLEDLRVFSSSKSVDGLLAPVVHCLKDAEEFAFLELYWHHKFHEAILPGWEAKFIHFFTTNQRLSQLKTLTLRTYKALISTELAKLVYNKCTNLMFLNISSLDVEAKKYVDELEKEAKPKNLDITISVIA